MSPRRIKHWRDAKGKRWTIPELSDDHLTNVMAVMKKRGGYPSLSVPADEFGQDDRADFVDDLICEARKRNLGNPWNWEGLA
jgi:hypothetical protein